MAPEAKAVDLDDKVDKALAEDKDAKVIPSAVEELKEILPDYTVGETYKFTNKESTPQRIFQYTQRPLGFGAKLEFVALLGGTIRDAVTGPGGTTVGALLAALPDMTGGEEVTAESIMSNVGSIDTLIGGLLPLAIESPDFMDELIVLALGVPRYERALIKILINQTPAEGGLDDLKGQQILDTFIDQNAVALLDFWKRQRVTARRLMGHLRPASSAGA